MLIFYECLGQSVERRLEHCTREACARRWRWRKPRACYRASISASTGDPDDWRGERRSNATHESRTDAEALRYRKSHAAPTLPSFLGHLAMGRIQSDMDSEET